MLINNKEYLDLISQIKQEIISSQQRAIWSVNGELIKLYWRIGKHINEHNHWGKSFIENMARDIKTSFPNIHGFSERNLRYMAKFASITDFEILQTVSAELSYKTNTKDKSRC